MRSSSRRLRFAVHAHARASFFTLMCRQSLFPTHSCGATVHARLTFSGTRILCGHRPHDLISELPEKCSLGRFCHEISDHVSSGAPCHRHFTIRCPVGCKITPNIDMLHSLAARSLAILLREDGTLVVLKNNVFIDSMSLCFHETAGPTHCGHAVVCCDDL